MKKSLIPYIIFGLFVTVIGILLIPLADMLGRTGVTYAEGFRSVFTYIFAAAAGVSFAFSLYRSDRKKDRNTTYKNKE